MQRRQLLKFGLVGFGLVALGGGGAALWKPALQNDRLTHAGRQALGALARAVLDGSLPVGDAALNQHLDHLDGVVQRMPPAVRAELQQLFSLCTNAGGRWLLWGGLTPLHELSLNEVQALLLAMRHSKLALRQQAYFALRDLNAAAHFAQPGAWNALGYPGPREI